MRTPWSALFRLAATQHGVVHLRQAEHLGIPASTFYLRAQREGWVRLQPGSWLVRGATRSFLGEATAAVQSVGARVALTGVSALHVEGVVDAPPSALQLAVAASRGRPSALRGVDDLVRTSTVPATAVRTVQGLPVLSVAWSLLHAGRKLRPRAVLELAVTAQQRGLLELAALDEVLEQCGRTAGRAALRDAVQALRADVVDSLLELDARRLVRSGGFEPFPSPFPFLCPDRRVVHLDLPFPAIWFAYECDSPQSRAGGRSFHTDRTRWSQAQKGGWRLGWITRDRLRNDGAGILEELADAFASADPERPAPIPTPCGHARCHACRNLSERSYG